MVKADFKDLSTLLAVLKKTSLSLKSAARTVLRLQDRDDLHDLYSASPHHEEYEREQAQQDLAVLVLVRRRQQNTAARRNVEFNPLNPELPELVGIIENCVPGLWDITAPVNTDNLRLVRRRCRNAIEGFRISQSSDLFQQTYFAKLSFMRLYKSLHTLIRPFCPDDGTCAYDGDIGDSFLGVSAALLRLKELLCLSAEDLRYIQENSTAYDPAVLAWHARHVASRRGSNPTDEGD